LINCDSARARVHCTSAANFNWDNAVKYYLPLDYFVYQEPRASCWRFRGKLVAISEAYIWQCTYCCDVCANCIILVNHHTASLKVDILILRRLFNFNNSRMFSTKWSCYKNYFFISKSEHNDHKIVTEFITYLKENKIKRKTYINIECIVLVIKL